MHTFRVWAPTAGIVEVDIEGRRTAMHAGDGGWWSAQLPEAGAGTDYAFAVDHGELLPDPRSPWQPDGIHGRSRLVDHHEFRWTDRKWQAPPLSSAIIYELHVGTFTHEGTFEAAIDRLDHLVELGVTHVELMPVNEFSGTRGWGYDGVDLYAPHHAYGGPAGLKRLVDACHGRGLAVLLDVVYNHLGPVGNYLGRFGPYFTERYATPWGAAVNFDGAYSDEVRQFFCDNALMWLRDYHFDGLRIDAVHAILDTSAVHILEQLSDQVDDLRAQLGRHLVLIPESDLNDPRLVRERAAGGYGLEAQWSDDLHHALHALLTGEREGYYADFGTIADLAKALRQAFVYDGCYSHHRKRRHGRVPSGLSGHCFLGYLQNHDQIGNRATGQRSSHLMSTGRLKIGAALVLTSPFVPMLFQGEEWGASTPFQYFTNHEDPQLGRAVREGRRTEFAAFGWRPEEIPNPQSVRTFERSKLDWSESDREPHCGLLDWHRRLIALRQRCPELTDGRMDDVEVSFDEPSRWITVNRGGVTVCCNLADQEQLIPLPAVDGQTPLLCSDDAIRCDGHRARMPGDSVVVMGPADAATG
jgi:maltooligosyltrehalose trehalohydrolase